MTRATLGRRFQMNSVIKISLVLGGIAVISGQYLGNGAAVAARPPVTSSAVNGQRIAEIYADPRGHYYSMAEIDHHLVHVMVDTGATKVALKYEDALELGLNLKDSDFRIPMSTANGIARAAAVELKSVKLGTVEVQYVKAVVMPKGAMTESLLGMSFLGEVSSVEVSNRRLRLKQ